ncbi:MAG TPA: T9SS type A sorting domain-containing protein, partial [Candidatus Eisenbacteria bacterium]|nr:T9SS type A sorting domain-containing protein [Candidatus Eisenbacteria bacterium]
ETRYWLTEVSRTGDVTWHGPATLASALPVPGRLLLAQSVPNPFRAGASTLIQFEVPGQGPASLEIFDLNGHRVGALLNEALPTGKHSVSWNGRDDRGVPLSPGVYFYRLNTTDGIRSRKLLLTP